MLLLPYVAGVIVAGFRWPDLPLLVTWLAGYLTSYFVLQAVKTRRLQRFRAPLTWYAPTTAVFGLVTVVACPRVLWWAPAYAALFAVNVRFAIRRDERAFLNDLASVAQSCLMVFVVATVATTPLHKVAVPFTLALLYFTGTVLYVKTMIRERHSVPYRQASIAYHAAALIAAASLGALPAIVFTLLLARAAILPRHSLTPKQIGLIEIAASLTVLTAACT
jgi:hypothetical protein